MDKLISELSEIFEVDKSVISNEKKFRKDFDGWDSLKAFALLTLLDDEYSKSINLNDLNSLVTIQDIIDLVKK